MSTYTISKALYDAEYILLMPFFAKKWIKKSTYEILKISFSGIINFYILPGVVTGAGVFTARESVHDPEHARSI